MRRSSHYRVYVIGPLPADLKDKISALHAAALLKQRKEEVAVDTIKGLRATARK